MVFTTLNKILSLPPSQTAWENLLRSLNKTDSDDELISLVQLVHISGLHFTLECCQLIPEFDKHWRLYAVWCARQVAWSSQYKNGTLAIALAERFANGQATQEEFEEEKEMQLLRSYSEMHSNGAPVKTAAATIHKIAGLAAQTTAASAAAGIAHQAGIRARVALPMTGDELVDACNLAGAYDSAVYDAYASARKAQEKEFIRLVTALK